jgi:hypothetical protein
MRKELGLLNFICLLVAVSFLALAVISVISSGDFLTIDNLFIITVSLVMALMFIVSPLLHLRSVGKLPLPFVKRSPSLRAADNGGPAPLRSAARTPPLLDAKGRAVPPDVKAIMNRMSPTEAKDA